MMNANIAAERPVIQHLLDSLQGAANLSRASQARPAAVLWTDHERQWQAAIPRLRAELPQLLVLGDYDPAHGQGPAIWLKCMVAGTLEETRLPDGLVPILYLPGVARADLRAIESCSRALQPLAELQYRGVFWSQVNGRDWSLNAFLNGSRGGLRLDLSGDRATRQALHRALDVLLDTPIDALRGRRLEADDFDALLSGDPVRDLLTWMDHPEQAAQDWQGPRWEAFSNRCRSDWRLDPEADGPLTALERLAAEAPGWEPLWERYTTSWRSFPQIASALETLNPPPKRDLFHEPSRYPRFNSDAEDTLRAALMTLANLAPADASSRLLDLEDDHGRRREWLWAEMGLAPLAMALEPLSALCRLVAEPLGGQSLVQLATAYRDRFWPVDRFARQALASVRSKTDRDAVSLALQAVYVPWLQQSAERFQALVLADGFPGSERIDVVQEARSDYGRAGQCWFFVDGLRYDVARDLIERLQAQGLTGVLRTTWAPVPSVTASGKVACSPVADQAAGRATDQDFVPSQTGEDRPLDTARLRSLLADQGWQILTGNDSGDPSGRAWLEFGDLDHYGHQHGLRLASEIPRMLDEILEQIQSLMAAGWQRIRLVTDHGWLLVPGGLPKETLPRFLTATRWGRCASLSPSAQPTALTLTWTWCPEVRIAMAPGIGSFIAGQDYAHGGLSLQELLIPVIEVTGQRDAGTAAARLEIASTWAGLRCRVQVTGAGAGFGVDLRQRANDPQTSCAGGVKVLKGDKASLLVADEDLEGMAVTLVVLNADGQPVQSLATVIGGGEG